jgi:hypothetical protein
VRRLAHKPCRRRYPRPRRIARSASRARPTSVLGRSRTQPRDDQHPSTAATKSPPISSDRLPGESLAAPSDTVQPRPTARGAQPRNPAGRNSARPRSTQPGQNIEEAAQTQRAFSPGFVAPNPAPRACRLRTPASTPQRAAPVPQHPSAIVSPSPFSDYRDAWTNSRCGLRFAAYSSCSSAPASSPSPKRR